MIDVVSSTIAFCGITFLSQPNSLQIDNSILTLFVADRYYSSQLEPVDATVSTAISLASSGSSSGHHSATSSGSHSDSRGGGSPGGGHSPQAGKWLVVQSLVSQYDQGGQLCHTVNTPKWSLLNPTQPSIWQNSNNSFHNVGWFAKLGVSFKVDLQTLDRGKDWDSKLESQVQPKPLVWKQGEKQLLVWDNSHWTIVWPNTVEVIEQHGWLSLWEENHHQPVCADKAHD